MRGKRKLIKEMNDSIFIAKAAKLGDEQAIKIYSLIVSIKEAENDLTKNIRNYSTETRIELFNRIDAMKRERDFLLYQYNITGKKARIYLDTLRAERKIKKDNRE